MIQKSKLSISVHEAQFSKDYQYMIVAQFQGQKVPSLYNIETNRCVSFGSQSYFHKQPFAVRTALDSYLARFYRCTSIDIKFVAQMLLPSEDNGSKQSTRVLGECSLDLSPFALQPTETYNLPIRQQLKFTKSKDGKEVTVGRFIASIKIVREDSLPTYLEDLEAKKIERNQYFVELPQFDPKFNFDWRIRLDVREAINVPSSNGLPAQLVVEAGWTQYRDSVPQESRLFSSAILPGPHPQWNQTFLISNPVHMSEPKGFLMVSLKDEHNLQDLYRLYLPVQSMGRFIPYNLKLLRDNQSPNPTQFFISALLQTPVDRRDQLLDIVVEDITFEPLTPFKQINIATVLNNDNEPKLQFVTVNPKQDSIQRVLQFDQAEQFNYILSNTMKVPPIKSGNYQAATVITLSEALLKRKVNFYLVAKTHKGGYKVAGLSESVQKDLVALLIDKTKKKLFLAVGNHPNAKFGSCQLQITSPQPLASSMASSRASHARGEETASEKLMKQLNFSNNESMLRHVAQNNDIIAKILRELDDKSESLREAAAEISNLRGRVKLLQNQNGILRQQALREEDQLVNLVQRQVENMSLRDLKQKIVKISQLYKTQRVKNRQLDRSVKAMQPQISNTMQLNSIIVAQKNTIQTLNDKIQRMVKQHERINVYKQTIRKQEKVIAKLETVMKDGMDQLRNARKNKLQLEELRKKEGMGGSRAISRGQERQEIQRLQGIIAQLQSTGKTSKVGGGDSSSNYELEFKLHQAETRIASLEHELQENSRSYARELAMLRMKVAEKEAVMNGYRN